MCFVPLCIKCEMTETCHHLNVHTLKHSHMYMYMYTILHVRTCTYPSAIPWSCFSGSLMVWNVIYLLITSGRHAIICFIDAECRECFLQSSRFQCHVPTITFCCMLYTVHVYCAYTVVLHVHVHVCIFTVGECTLRKMQIMVQCI